MKILPLLNSGEETAVKIALEYARFFPTLGRGHNAEVKQSDKNPRGKRCEACALGRGTKADHFNDYTSNALEYAYPIAKRIEDC